MYNESSIVKSTLKIFYIAYILTSLGGLIFMRNVSLFVFSIQLLTLFTTTLMLLLLYIFEEFRFIHHFSIIFYSLIVLTGMWYGLGSASILYLVFSITLIQVIILTFKEITRLIYLGSFTLLTGTYLFIDYMYRSDNPNIELFDQGRLIGVSIIIGAMILILILNRIFIEDLLKQLKNYSYFDVLTGIKNSRAFYEEIKSYDSDFDRYDINYVLAYLDIDKYKEINDLHGHLVGDEILQEFSKIIHNSIRPGDEIYRIGGDEFVLILQNISIEQATQKLQQLHDKIISKKIKGEILEFSYGLASKNIVKAEVETLLNLADKSMYENKSVKK